MGQRATNIVDLTVMRCTSSCKSNMSLGCGFEDVCQNNLHTTLHHYVFYITILQMFQRGLKYIFYVIAKCLGILNPTVQNFEKEEHGSEISTNDLKYIFYK